MKENKSCQDFDREWRVQIALNGTDMLTTLIHKLDDTLVGTQSCYVCGTQAGPKQSCCFVFPSKLGLQAIPLHPSLLFHITTFNICNHTTNSNIQFNHFYISMIPKETQHPSALTPHFLHAPTTCIQGNYKLHSVHG